MLHNFGHISKALIGAADNSLQLLWKWWSIKEWNRVKTYNLWIFSITGKTIGSMRWIFIMTWLNRTIFLALKQRPLVSLLRAARKLLAIFHTHQLKKFVWPIVEKFVGWVKLWSLHIYMNLRRETTIQKMLWSKWFICEQFTYEVLKILNFLSPLYLHISICNTSIIRIPNYATVSIVLIYKVSIP